MISLGSLLSLAHLVGLVVCVGAATVKLVLLLKSRADAAFVPVYLAVVRPITRLIVLGMVLLTLSGVTWLVLGYALTTRLVVKLALLVAVWVAGAMIDKVVEPRFQRLAPASGQAPSAAFLRAQQQYVALEVTADLLFYVIVVMWVLR